MKSHEKGPVTWARFYESIFILANVSQRQVHVYALYTLEFALRCQEHAYSTLV